ncbi:MAG: hypothetical protein Q9217_002923 [Psora testacea]
MQVLPPSHRLSMGLPSPTLTNPDMILPFDNPSSQHSSPLPPRRPQQMSSPPTNQEEHARPGSMENRTRLKHAGQSLSPSRNDVLSCNDGPTRVRSNSERSNGRITYENSRLSYRPSGTGPIASSPTLPDDYNDAPIDHLAESPRQEDHLAHNTYKTPSILEEDEDDPESHAAMTKRAEEILANAKKRLTNMEGNLNRARSTLNSRPSSSMSSFADREPVSLYSIQKDYKKHGGFSPLKHREASSSLRDAHQGHARVFSETSVPSSLQTSQPRSHSKDGNAGLSTDSNDADTPWKDHDSEPARNWFWNGLIRTTSLANRHNNGLQPLHEDGPAPDSFDRQGLREEQEDEHIETRRAYHEQQISAASNANAERSPNSGLTRAKSTTQMRDLREQMSDLKGKIITLKQRAREDSLRRRSLQSLRTPSPLNAAQQDYSGVPLAEGQRRGTGLDLLGIIQSSPQETRPKASGATEQAGRVPQMISPIENGANDEEADRDSGIGLPEAPNNQMQIPPATFATEASPAAATHSPPKDEFINILPPESIALPMESDFGDQETNELGEDLNSVEEPRVVEGMADGDQDHDEPVGERHEDRADAFDYEHFFLHSSMGHYGRNRSSTHSSNFSVETEKPAPNRDREEGDTGTESPGKHSRQNSVGSISTVATFATATEGIDDEEQECTPRQSMAGDWHVESSKTNGHKHSKGRTHSSPKSKEARNENLPRKHHKGDIGENVASLPTGPADVLTYLASLIPEGTGEPVKPFRLSNSDKELAERVIMSLARVCRELQHINNNEGGTYEARICRRKLDTARRHLDGEVNGEAF